jgi:hypothetical protein
MRRQLPITSLDERTHPTAQGCVMYQGGHAQVLGLVQRLVEPVRWRMAAGECLCDKGDPLCDRDCGRHQALGRHVYGFFTSQMFMRVHEQTGLWLRLTVRLVRNHWDRLGLTPCNLAHVFLGMLLLVIKYTDDTFYELNTYARMVPACCHLGHAPTLAKCEAAVFERMGWRLPLRLPLDM